MDAVFGTQFTIVQANDVQTPRPSALQRLQSSITGVTDFEVLGQLRHPVRIDITDVVVGVSTLHPTAATQ